MPDQFISPEFNIPYDESAWQAQSLGETSQTASRRFQVDGENAAKFVQEFLGWTQFDPGGGGKLNRHPPAIHPRFPWLNARTAQFVRECGPNRANGPGGTLNFDVEEWEIAYAADEDKLVRWYPDNLRPPGIAGEAWRYVARRVELAVTVQTLNTGALLFNKPDDKGNNPVVPDGATGQLIPSRTRWMTWFQIPVTLGDQGIVLPGRLQQTIDETVGHMNGTPFDGAAPQTLLLLDPKLTLRLQSDGTPCVDIAYSISVRGGPDVSAIGLNNVDTDTPDFTRIMRANGKYGRVYRKSDPLKVKSIYDARDFNRLFEFD